MLEKLFKKSEIWFAVAFIIAYVIGNSVFMQVSDGAGLEMVFTIPFNLALLGVLFAFIKKNRLSAYYGLNRVQCRAGKVLYYVPLILIATVNVWLGFCFKMSPLNAVCS